MTKVSSSDDLSGGNEKQGQYPYKEDEFDPMADTPKILRAGSFFQDKKGPNERWHDDNPQKNGKGKPKKRQKVPEWKY